MKTDRSVQTIRPVFVPLRIGRQAQGDNSKGGKKQHFLKSSSTWERSVQTIRPVFVPLRIGRQAQGDNSKGGKKQHFLKSSSTWERSANRRIHLSMNDISLLELSMFYRTIHQLLSQFASNISCSFK